MAIKNQPMNFHTFYMNISTKIENLFKKRFCMILASPDGLVSKENKNWI